MATKKTVVEQLKLLANLVKQAENLQKMIEKELPDDPRVKQLLTMVTKGVMPDSFICETLKGIGALNNLEDGDDTQYPSLFLSCGGSVMELHYPVDGGILQAYVNSSDYGTHQAGIMYVSENDNISDLAMAEVKRGELAEIDHLPADNKDVSLYVYGDPLDENYTEKIQLSYENLSRDE